MNVFKSEIGTEINIDGIISVSPMCDAYGATIQENGKIYDAWYRVCVEDKTKDAWGGYGDGNSGWINRINEHICLAQSATEILIRIATEM